MRTPEASYTLIDGYRSDCGIDTDEGMGAPFLVLKQKVSAPRPGLDKDLGQCSSNYDQRLIGKALGRCLADGLEGGRRRRTQATDHN
jgi:hypothetical protein